MQKRDNGVIFKIKVYPGAAKNEIVGVQEDVLKIKINAAPVKAKANKAKEFKNLKCLSSNLK